MRSDRRGFLTGSAALGACFLAGYASAGALPGRSGLRVAFLTDPHVSPHPQAMAGFARALEHAQERQPDLIFCGGDAIMDALNQPREAVDAQWQAYRSVLAQHSSQKVWPVLGNHDIFGWGTPEAHPDGKRMGCDGLEMDQPYYVLDRPPWRLIVLDSTHFAPQRPGGYEARLDAAQVDWLSQRISETSFHVAIISHIPIFSACAFFDGPNETSGNWMVPGAWMHLDARMLKTMFRQQGKVKVCLSGHTHLVDKVEYLGVTYLCCGAVSGNYWTGPTQEFPPSYALVDLYADGSVNQKTVLYDVP